MAKHRAERTLQRLESHLQNHDWLALERPTIADCAVCPYVLPTPEGGMDLEPWPAILAWMPRIKELPACCAPG
nr:glutathione binding-like protein [Frateuria aurantia]